MKRILYTSLVIFVALATLFACRKPKPDDAPADGRQISEATYILPFLNGESYELTDGNAGDENHRSGTLDEYAFDFRVNIGTVVVAARSGIVSHVEESYTQNYSPAQAAGDPDLFYKANRVVIDHGDGTSALYMHLRENGALVKIGDKVTQGQPIALCGRTGVVLGPRLHFMVMETSKIGGWFNQSIKISFKDVLSNEGIPTVGNTYTAQHSPMGSTVKIEGPITAVSIPHNIGENKLLSGNGRRITFTLKNQLTESSTQMTFALVWQNNKVLWRSEDMEFKKGESKTIVFEDTINAPIGNYEVRVLSSYGAFTSINLNSFAECVQQGCNPVTVYVVSGEDSTQRIINVSGDLNFGDVVLNGILDKTITINNNGIANLTINEIQSPSLRVWTEASFPMTIPPGQSEQIPIRFSPDAPIVYSGYLTVLSDATSGTNNIFMSGRGIEDTAQYAMLPFMNNYTVCPPIGLDNHCGSHPFHYGSFKMAVVGNSVAANLQFKIIPCDNTTILSSGRASIRKNSPCGVILSQTNTADGLTFPSNLSEIILTVPNDLAVGQTVTYVAVIIMDDDPETNRYCTPSITIKRNY